jgi:hypothetical protein
MHDPTPATDNINAVLNNESCIEVLYPTCLRVKHT